MFSFGLGHNPFLHVLEFEAELFYVEELTHKFYQISISVDHHDIDKQIDVRYIKCLNYTIQDELSMHRIHVIEQVY